MASPSDPPWPRLDWAGRASTPPPDGRPDGLPQPPAQIEHHAAAASLIRPADRPPGRLIHGDNLDVMRSLEAELRGRIDLIYVDPPFGTGGAFVLRPQPGDMGRPAYRDAWAGGLRGYLDMLEPRIRLMRSLLSPTGSFYIHLDPTASHYVKVLLDEIFGPECFQREIVWRIGWVSGYKGKVRNWVRNHDTILFYTRQPAGFYFHKVYVPHRAGYARRGGGEGPGHPVDDVWNGSPAEHQLQGADALDSIQIKSFSSEKTGYETQKNESLLRRIIEASSPPGGLVADFFCGSGTALAVADRLDRQYIGCDIGAAAVHVARKRLLELGARDRGSFRIEGSRPAAGDFADLSIEVGRAAVRLRDPDAADYWAVQWNAGDGALRPDFIAYRTRGKPEMAAATTTELRPIGPRYIAAHMADGSGVLSRQTWRVADSG